MAKRKRRRATPVKKDIISNSAEHLMDLIFERLPMDDAVRTSVLSTKWRYKWTTMRALTISQQFSKRFIRIGPYHPNGFITVINQIMIHHNGPLLKFYLYIPNIVLDSFQEVDQWMLMLPGKGVRVLTLISINQIYPGPSSVYSCLELRQFGLFNCIFNPPLEFQGFLSLEHLCFERVDFGGNLGGTIINLPHLTELTMEKCENCNNFNIKAEKLRLLWVISCPDAMLLLYSILSIVNAFMWFVYFS
ncbi:hypothetical protein L1987_00852 [Smallanthus sonchifolius]|uniref:Uncharacterized protein n=1 Tax=Smallanthus sonchifolius TaxID=185202 RepID=A0ACB9K3J8_9ASTR|nr:hypothetical protein L1987_00852 [Smallanthus sonchifolius]